MCTHQLGAGAGAGTCVHAPAGCLHRNICVCKSWEQECRPCVCTRVCLRVQLCACPRRGWTPPCQPQTSSFGPAAPLGGGVGGPCWVPGAFALSCLRARVEPVPLMLRGSAEGARAQIGASFAPQPSSSSTSSSSSQCCSLHRCQTKAWAADVRDATDVRDAADVAPTWVSWGQPAPPCTQPPPPPNLVVPYPEHPTPCDVPRDTQHLPVGTRASGSPGQSPTTTVQTLTRAPPKPSRGNPGIRAPSPSPSRQKELAEPLPLLFPFHFWGCQNYGAVLFIGLSLINLCNIPVRNNV